MTTETALIESGVKSEVVQMVDVVNELEIVDKKTFDIAGTYALSLKKLKTEVIEYFKPLKEAAHKAHKGLTQREKDELKPITYLETIVRKGRQEYQADQERIRREEQERLEAEAKKKADAERERLLKRASNAKKPEKQEELLKQAEEVVEEPVFADKPIEKTTELEGGGSTTWIDDIEVTVTDKMLLCRAIADYKVPLTVVEFKNLKQWVKANDIKPGQIQGLLIRPFKRESIRS